MLGRYSLVSLFQENTCLRNGILFPFSSVSTQVDYMKSLIQSFKHNNSNKHSQTKNSDLIPCTLQKSKNKSVRKMHENSRIVTVHNESMKKNFPVFATSKPGFVAVTIPTPKDHSKVRTWTETIEGFSADTKENIIIADSSVNDEISNQEFDLNPTPVSTVMNHKQTVSETIIMLRQWFKQLDISKVSITPQPAVNLAPYVPSSYTLLQLTKLGVDLSKIEAIPGVANMLVKLNFHTDVEPFLWKLSDFGFKPEQIARILTVFPKILKLSEDDLNDRISYFSNREFSNDAVVEMINRYPSILEKMPVDVDRQLSQIQDLFELSDSDLRRTILFQPNLIYHPLFKIKDVFVVLTKMMGFPIPTTKVLIKTNPKILISERERLMTNFSIMHTRLGLPCELIQLWPEALSAASHILLQRSMFLVHRKLLQTDPSKPLYTPMSALATATDEEFCHEFGFTTEADYDDFLRTL